MKEQKKKKTSLIASVCLLVAAAGLLTVAGIGGTRAILQYQSDYFKAHVEMYDIGVSLTEQGNIVSYRNYEHFTDEQGHRNSKGTWDLSKENLLQNLLADGEDFIIGQSYPEELAVTNTGSINEFVRVTIYKYWANKDGEKDPTLDPGLIHIDWANLDSDWIVASENNETMVLYYNKLLHAGSSTAPFTSNLTVYIDETVKGDYEVVQEGNVIIYKYRYDGSEFRIEAKVDAVQEHNAEDAILSAWGINASVSGESLSVAPY